MATVILVRHGESLWNRERRFQGQSGPGLTDLGVRQAKQTAEHLLSLVADPDVLVRSDLERVEQTAAAAENALGMTATADPRWREIDVGDWTGRLHRDVASTDAAALRAWRKGRDIRRGSGERFSDLRRRVSAALTDAVERAGDGTALIFTHGGPVRVAAGLALGQPGEVVLAPVGNCAITVLDMGTRPRLAVYGATGHLGDR